MHLLSFSHSFHLHCSLFWIFFPLQCLQCALFPVFISFMQLKKNVIQDMSGLEVIVFYCDMKYIDLQSIHWAWLFAEWSLDDIDSKEIIFQGSASWWLGKAAGGVHMQTINMCAPHTLSFPRQKRWNSFCSFSISPMSLFFILTVFYCIQ